MHETYVLEEQSIQKYDDYNQPDPINDSSHNALLYLNILKYHSINPLYIN